MENPSNPMGIPVWSHDGTICTGEIYKQKVKLTFAKGASLEDPADLFNTSLDAKVSRAIDIYEGDEIDEEAFKSLIRGAMNLNEGACAVLIDIDDHYLIKTLYSSWKWAAISPFH